MEFKSRRTKAQFRKKGDEKSDASDTASTSSPPSTPSASNTSTSPTSPTSTPSATPKPSTPSASTPTTPSATATTPSSTPTNGTKVEKKNEKPKPTLLSFGEDEEEEEFQVKRTNRSKKMMKEIQESKERPLHRELPPVVSTATAAMSGGAGEYTPEKMEELRKNAMAYTKPKQETPTPEKEPEIPTPAQIHAARERRKGVREGKDGFIPLDDSGKGDKAKGRLVREDGEDDDADEEGRGSDSRIDFAGNSKKGGKALPEPIAVEDDPEDDEELKRWELDRIRKGVGAAEMKRKDLVDKARTNKSPARAGLDLAQKSTVTIDTITKDVKSTLAKLQEAHRSHNAQLERIKDELRSAQEASESMQEQVKDGADEYSFFAGMKIYVADLLDCLGAKAELVEQAEDKQIAAYRVRNAKSRAYAQRKLDAAAQEMKEIAEEAAGYSKGPPKARPPRPKEGEKKKRARGEEEGWSSDSESEEVRKEFDAAESAAREAGGAVFADVDEQYCTIQAIKGKFEKWKKDYPGSYKQAYISLSMPQLFSPFVRLQLLSREPLTAGLESMQWFTDLLAYGMSDSGEAVEDDEDNFLVPKLVEKVIVPRIQDGLTHVWNPQSRTSNTRAVAAVQELFVYADAFSGNMKEMFAGVLGNLQNAVQELRIPIYHYPKGGDIGSRLPWEFACKMMWRGIKLLQNITAWHEILAAGPLQQLAIDTLITGKLLPFLRTLRDSNTSVFLDAYESITKCLPSSWTAGKHSEESAQRGEYGVAANLAIFHDPLLTATRKLAEEDRRERNSRERNRERDQEREKMLASACRSLAKLGDNDNASLISRACGIKM